MNVTLRQLRVFRAVVQGGSFSRAGDEIGLTQPAVSRAIVELESQLGLRLLDRTTREVLPTPAGHALAGRLDRLLDEVDQTLLDVAVLADAGSGTVRVASSPTLSANLMPACIAACAREAPEIAFRLLDRIQQDVLENVRAGAVDFGVAVEPSSLDDLDGEEVLREPFVLVVPTGHALARQTRVRWSALDGLPLVLLDAASGSRRLIDAALARHGARGVVMQEVGHPTTAYRMIEAGIGISVLPALALPPAGLDRLVVRPLVPRTQRSIMLIRRRNRALTPPAQRVWALVRDRIAATARERA